MENKSEQFMRKLDWGSLFFCLGGALVTFIFLLLKLYGVWDVSWFWVWFPLWVCPAAILALGIIFVLVGIMAGCILAGRQED